MAEQRRERAGGTTSEASSKRKVERRGVIEETLPKGLFRVVLAEDGKRITASIATSAKRVTVKLIPGDRVTIELSPFDPSRGRIIARHP